ncbi:MAG: hypothetical protein WBO10_00175 [Pyrinomonadaceae bacterium]
MIQKFKYILTSVCCGLLLATAILGQSTAFTYQGSLTDGASPANGNYDLDFRLFSAASGGSQQGTTITANNVAVANGVFSVTLDFGSQFPGANRFMEIRVRSAGGGAFTLLTPRQPVNSSPYSIKSLTADTATNATQLGGFDAAGFIRNGTGQQAASNFSISGNGTAGGTLRADIVRSDTQFNIGADRILSNAGSSNIFVGKNAGRDNTGSFNSFLGVDAGRDNTTGTYNSFFGAYAGQRTTTGSSNAFFGAGAGLNNTSGASNSFFGTNAGSFNTIGSSNAFFGDLAGSNNTTGQNNAFFGYVAGQNTTTGASNAFFGVHAGQQNTTGGYNAFFGLNAGNTNTTGIGNTIIGNNADVLSNNLSYATAVGSDAVVSTSNTVVLGRTTDTVRAPGTMIVGNSTVQRGDVNFYANSGNFDLYMQSAGGTSGINFGVNSGPTLFISQYDGTTYQNRLVITATGTVQVNNLGAAGATSLCRNASNEISTCSPGNGNSEVEDVKYDRLSSTFAEAIKAQQTEISGQQSVIGGQQAQIEVLQQQVEEQQSQIDALKALVCAQNATAAICRQK